MANREYWKIPLIEISFKIKWPLGDGCVIEREIFGSKDANTIFIRIGFSP